MPRYECWEKLDGDYRELSFFPEDTLQRKLNTRDVDGGPLTHMYTIIALDWPQALQYHQEAQGWTKKRKSKR